MSKKFCNLITTKFPKKYMFGMLHSIEFSILHNLNSLLQLTSFLLVGEVNYKIVPQPRWEERYPYDKYSVLHYNSNYRLKSLIVVSRNRPHIHFECTPVPLNVIFKSRYIYL